MNGLFNFFTGSFNSLLLFQAISNHEVYQIFHIDRLLSALVVLIGGIISTLNINILKNKYPKLFKPAIVKASKKISQE